MQQSTVPELVYAVSHDIAEPIREIIGFAQLMAERAPQDVDPGFWDDLSHIEAGALRARSMLQALGDFIAVETEAAEVDEFDLAELIDDVLTDTAPIRAEHPATVTADLHGVVRGPRDLIHDIIVELVTNAARFGTNRDSGTAHISIGCAVDNGVLEFSVSDTGDGLTNDMVLQASLLFGRLHRHTNDTTVGAGLALARRRVTTHGGDLRLDTNSTGGLTAVVTIPVREIDLRASRSEGHLLSVS